MTDSDARSARRAGIAGLATLSVVVVVGYVLLYGDEGGQLVAGGVIMLGAVFLGLLEARRSQTRVGLVGGSALMLGGSLGLVLVATSHDPFTNPLVLVLLVVGLVSGLFSPVPEDDDTDSPESPPDTPDDAE